MLTIRCHFHPRYQGIGIPKRECETCRLLYLLVSKGPGDARDVASAVGVLKRLGSGLIAGSLKDDDVWEQALEGMETGKPAWLRVRCGRHGYKATRRPGWRCGGCMLLYTLKYQRHREGEQRLGPFNPYMYFMNGFNLRRATLNLLVFA